MPASDMVLWLKQWIADQEVLGSIPVLLEYFLSPILKIVREKLRTCQSNIVL